MKACLIQTPWIINKNSRVQLPYPLGLMYIGAFLEKNGIEVEIFDALALGFENWVVIDAERARIGLSYEAIRDYLAKSNADFFGISCQFTTQSENMHWMAALIKELKGKPVFVGGAHPSLLPVETIEDKNIDFVIKGEGEFTALELINKLSRSEPIENVKGVYFKNRETGKINFTGEREPITDLNILPFPAYHLINLDIYINAIKQGVCGRDSTSSGSRWAEIVTSRGCPYRCIFCSSCAVWGHKWRYRSPENILAEIKSLYTEHNIDCISFEDDNLTLLPERVERLLELIIHEQLKISWDVPNGIRADQLTLSLIKMMKKSGCAGLTIGIESGDEYFVNKVIKKSLSLEKVMKNARLIVKENIPLNCFFVIGIPGETKKIFENSLQFARRLARLGAFCIFFIAVPLPGTELYEKAKEQNFLIKDKFVPFDYLMGMDRPLLKTGDYEPADLLRWRKKANIVTLLELIIWNPVFFFKSNIFRSILSKGPLYLFKRCIKRIS